MRVIVVPGLSAAFYFFMVHGQDSQPLHFVFVHFINLTGFTFEFPILQFIFVPPSPLASELLDSAYRGISGHSYLSVK